MAKAKTSRKPKLKTPKAEPALLRVPKAPPPKPIQTHEELGAYLAEQRKEARLTMQKVSEETRIRLQYVKDIERGDFTKLPADIYVRAYLKSYAKCVGADGARILALYETIGKDDVVEDAELQQEKKSEKAKPEPRQDASRPGTRLVILSLAAAAVAYGLWYNFRFAEKAAPVVSPPEIVAKQPEAASHEIVLLALQDAEFVIAIEGVKGTRTLAAGETFALPDVTKASLELSDPAALEIYLDGEAVPMPAPSGENGRTIVLDVETLKPAPVIH